MPAYVQQTRTVRPRERAFALAAVALVQAGLAFALLTGLHVDVSRSGEIVQRLIDITLQKPPPPVVVPPPPKPRHRQASAPKAAPEKLGGSPGPRRAHAFRVWRGDRPSREAKSRRAVD